MQICWHSRVKEKNILIYLLINQIWFLWKKKWFSSKQKYSFWQKWIPFYPLSTNLNWWQIIHIHHRLRGHKLRTSWAGFCVKPTHPRRIVLSSPPQTSLKRHHFHLEICWNAQNEIPFCTAPFLRNCLLSAQPSRYLIWSHAFLLALTDWPISAPLRFSSEWRRSPTPLH